GRPPRPTLFPSTTLFRSDAGLRRPFFEPHRHDPRDVGVGFRDCCAGREPRESLVVELAKSQLRAIEAERQKEIGVDVEEAEIPRSEEHTSELQSRENLVC